MNSSAISLKDEVILSKNTITLSKQLNVSFDEARHLKETTTTKYINTYHWKSLPCAPKSFPSDRNITFGDTSVENLFGGIVIPSNCSINIFGTSQSGKTQLSLSAAICSALEGKKVLIIDTCNGISLKRIKMMILLKLQLEMSFSSEDMSERDSKLISTLDNIRVERLFDIFSLFKLLQSLSLESNQLELVLIDNLSTLVDTLPINNKKGSYNMLLTSLLPQLQCLLKSLLQFATVIITTSCESNTDSNPNIILHEFFDFVLQTRPTSNPIENDYETIIDIKIVSRPSYLKTCPEISQLRLVKMW